MFVPSEYPVWIRSRSSRHPCRTPSQTPRACRQDCESTCPVSVSPIRAFLLPESESQAAVGDPARCMIQSKAFSIAKAREEINKHKCGLSGNVEERSH